jgi:hypothetical protein
VRCPPAGHPSILPSMFFGPAGSFQLCFPNFSLIKAARLPACPYRGCFASAPLAALTPAPLRPHATEPSCCLRRPQAYLRHLLLELLPNSRVGAPASRPPVPGGARKHHCLQHQGFCFCQLKLPRDIDALAHSLHSTTEPSIDFADLYSPSSRRYLGPRYRLAW